MLNNRPVRPATLGLGGDNTFVGEPKIVVNQAYLQKKYAGELQALQDKILTLGKMVTRAISDACGALETWQPDPALATIAGDLQVNTLEVDIDEMCLTIIALWQPVATDLRFITTAMKIVTTLERIGDLAVNISRYALELINHPEGQVDIKAPLAMAPQVQKILQQSLRAFVNQDADLALATARCDQAIDQLYKTNLWDTVSRMQGQEIATMNNIMRSFMISKFLERIGDHAVHICEMVVFMVKGRIIRHQKPTLDYLDEEFH